MVFRGGLVWRQGKKLKTIFRMNELFQGESRRRRDSGSKIEKRETRDMARERTAT